MSDMPGLGLAGRPLHFIWIADCSGSMSEAGKIQALNHAIEEALPHLRDAAASHPQVDMRMRVLAFASGARWHVADPTPIDEFDWPPLTAGGVTDLGAALREVAAQMHAPPMERRALPPVLVLVSDGEPTDDFAGGLAALLNSTWGSKAVRMAIAIGRDANLDVLQRFIAHPELRPQRAASPEDLARLIQWASTVAVQRSTVVGGSSTSAPPPPTRSDVFQQDTWL